MFFALIRHPRSSSPLPFSHLSLPSVRFVHAVLVARFSFLACSPCFNLPLALPLSHFCSHVIFALFFRFFFQGTVICKRHAFSVTEWDIILSRIWQRVIGPYLLMLVNVVKKRVLRAYNKAQKRHCSHRTASIKKKLQISAARTEPVGFGEQKERERSLSI